MLKMAENQEHDVSWALKLLASDAEREHSVLSKYGGTVVATTAGFITAFFTNFAGGRPVLSGIPKYIVFPIVFGAAARWYEMKGASSLAERDAVLRHYIMLHPEDFPEPERKKFGEVLNRWTPIR